MNKLIFIGGLGTFILLWKLAAALSPLLIPTPFSVYQSGEAEFLSGKLLELFMSSLKHYLIGVCLGISLAIIIGAASGIYPKLASFIYGFIAIIRPVPAIAWIPFAIVCLGVTHAAASALIVSGVFWICFFSVDSAFRNTNPDYLELAEIYGYKSKFSKLKSIYFPASLPQIMTAVRTSTGQAWTFLIAAELFGVPGIGQRMWEAAGLLANNIVAFYLIVVCAVYLITDLTLLKIEKNFVIWK